MPDVPLPPWARKIQQGWLWQAVLLPVFMGFGSSLVLNGCLANGVQNVTTVCLWGAVNSTIAAMLTAVFSGHSPGSASFKPNGEPDKVVANVAEVTKAVAATPTPEIKMAAQSIAMAVATQAEVVKEAVK